MRGEKLEVGESEIRSFHDLRVYQRGYQLALLVHEMARTLPTPEKFELGAQLRRAAVSIPANIAEGYGRKNSVAEFKHFLRNALGSSNEMQVLVQLAIDLGYWTDVEVVNQYNELGKQIYSLIQVWK